MKMAVELILSIQKHKVVLTKAPIYKGTARWTVITISYARTVSLLHPLPGFVVLG